MYKAIDFPSPLLLFLALFRSLSLSCSLLLSLSLSGGGGGFGRENLPVILLFEVPILAARMRRLPYDSTFLMFFNKKTKSRIAICISILVGLQSELFALPSDTLSQKMRFRVGRPHFFS